MILDASKNECSALEFSEIVVCYRAVCLALAHHHWW